MPDPAAASSLGFKPSVGLGCCLVLSGFSLLQCFSDQRCESGSARREVVAVARATGGVCKGSLCPVRIPRPRLGSVSRPASATAVFPDHVGNAGAGGKGPQISEQVSSLGHATNATDWLLQCRSRFQSIAEFQQQET